MYKLSNRTYAGRGFRAPVAIERVARSDVAERVCLGVAAMAEAVPVSVIVQACLPVLDEF